MLADVSEYKEHETMPMIKATQYKEYEKTISVTIKTPATKLGPSKRGWDGPCGLGASPQRPPPASSRIDLPCAGAVLGAWAPADQSPFTGVS